MDKPNILFFHIDNISQGDIGCYGGAITLGAKTPNIDEFASESFLLTNYNVEAQCTPTRSALLTGRHPIRTGCITALPGSGLVAWELTIADQLKKLGYNNAIYGKWHCGEEAGRYPTDKGFDYWLGINGSWDSAYWPQDKWFNKEDFEPEHIIESTKKGEIKKLKILDAETRRNIDLEFLDKAGKWMENSVKKDTPFFIYFNHSNLHIPNLPRQEYIDSSNGGAVADCIQMIDGDLKILLDKIGQLGIKDNTIVIVAGDNGRDNASPPNDRSSEGNWRGGLFSTFEGNNRTVGMIRWPEKIKPRRSDEMMHVVDWFPSLLNMIGHKESVPTDRVIDGINQSDFIIGQQDHSNRNYFHMYFDKQHVGMRYKNFKVLTHIVESAFAPIQKLAVPHIYNLTVNPDEDTPYYELTHSWMLGKVFLPKTKGFQESLKKDSVPFGAPLTYNPYDNK